MKKSVIILSALALFAAVSCNKAEVPAQRSEKHPVTLAVGLGAETRVSHPLDGTTIKPEWENTDYVFVKGDDTDVWEKFLIDEATISSDGKSASFFNGDSVLEENETCTVVYATEAFLSDATDPTTFSVASGQDGSLANLPEYLVAENVIPGQVVELTSQLTYFHFIFKDTDNSTSYYYLDRVRFGQKKSGGFPGLPGGSGGSYTGEFYASPSTTTKKDISINGHFSDDIDPVRYLEVYAAVFLPNDDAAGKEYHVLLEDVSGFGHTHDFHTTPITLSWTSKNKYQAGEVYAKTFEF